MPDSQERARLNALRQLKLLDTSPNESFDRVTRTASQIFNLPVAAISLTDADRQWFKSRVGIEHASIPRLKAPCAQVALSTEPLVIEDLRADPVYADSVLARSGTRFYAGAPLVTKDGFGLGSLCVLGSERRQASARELAALVDLAAIVMAQIELQHAFGRIDSISGLPNRSQFYDDVADLERDHPGEGRFIAVLDLARDEQISWIMRVMGGAQVDAVIREASQMLQAAIGPDRTAYHIGPAQFAVISKPDLAQDAYIRLLRSHLDASSLSSLARFVTDRTIGVRPFTVGATSAPDILRGASSAAQDARSAHSSVALYSEASDRTHRRRYRLLRDFGTALEADDQLHLVYQPKIALATGHCVGAEALLRWDHPELGAISPAEFIPIIEQTSLAQLTTRWVVDTALDQLARWALEGIKTTLSVNFSAANLTEKDLIARLERGLAERGLDREQLEIELTESAVMVEPGHAIAVLNDLAAAGFSLAIDDFGTGHSGLAYLQQLPVQVVKIDRAFVGNLAEAGASDRMLAKTIIELAQGLGFRVVAEGVETEATARILKNLGCEEAQGYLFSRPLVPDAFARYIAAHAAQDHHP